MQTVRHIKILSAALLTSFSMLSMTQSACGQLMSSVRSKALEIYRSCTFHDGLQLVEIDPLAPGVTARGVETAQGLKSIRMLSGNRIGFAYPGTDIFANVKVEQLPKETWGSEKKILQQNADYLLHNSPEFKADPIPDQNLLKLNAQGITKTSLSGGVLAFYILFDNPRHVVITIYLLNQEPSQRNFQTIAGFRTLESRFLRTYAACISATKYP